MIIHKIENTETKNSVKITIKDNDINVVFSTKLSDIKKDKELRQGFIKLMLSLGLGEELEKELLKFIKK